MLVFFLLLEKEIDHKTDNTKEFPSEIQNAHQIQSVNNPIQEREVELTLKEITKENNLLVPTGFTVEFCQTFKEYKCEHYPRKFIIEKTSSSGKISPHWRAPHAMGGRVRLQRKPIQFLALPMAGEQKIICDKGDNNGYNKF